MTSFMSFVVNVVHKQRIIYFRASFVVTLDHVSEGVTILLTYYRQQAEQIANSYFAMLDLQKMPF